MGGKTSSYKPKNVHTQLGLCLVLFIKIFIQSALHVVVLPIRLGALSNRMASWSQAWRA